jgi:hypothetical protein
MTSLRSLSRRSLAALVAVPVVAVAGTVAAARVTSGSGTPPPAKALPTAIHDALSAPRLEGVSARVTFTNRLIESGAVTGIGSPLLSGASGRIWASPTGVRLELQSPDGKDDQIVWHAGVLTVYDASQNTVYRFTAPKAATARPTTSEAAVPALGQIQLALAAVGQIASLTGATPTTQAGRPAYSVQLSPRHDGGLLGAVQAVWDARTGVPLRVAVYASGTTTPVLDLKATSVHVGAVPASDIAIAPPSGAKVVDLSRAVHPTGEKSASPSGAAAPAVTAKATLVGLPKVSDRTIDWAGSPARVLVYGHGLGAVVVVARNAGASSKADDPLSALPTVSIAGASGHELPTALGTVLSLKRGAVEYLVLGSLPTTAAEAAARELLS